MAALVWMVSIISLASVPLATPVPTVNCTLMNVILHHAKMGERVLIKWDISPAIVRMDSRVHNASHSWIGVV